MKKLIKIHKLIDKKEFQKAIKNLNEIIEVYKSNEYILKLLDYCRKHDQITKRSNHGFFDKNESKEDFKLIFNLLKEFDLNSFFGKEFKLNKLSLKDIEVIENLSQSPNSFNTLKGLCEVLKLSPLQYTTLYYVASLVNFFELNELLDNLNLKSESINLLNLIKSIYDPFEYIKVREFLSKRGIKWENLIHFDLIDFSKDSLLDIEKKIKIIISEYKKVEDSSSLEKNINISAGSIFLNESKYIVKNLLNHYDLLDEWILVEGACLGYPSERVTNEGFSIDYSSLLLSLFPDPANKLNYVPNGWTINEGEMAKCELRNGYLKRITGDILVVIDIDEFYTQNSFELGVSKIKEGYICAVLPQIHLWKSLDKFITGMYYDVSHTRFFKAQQGLIYKQNHNFPENTNNELLNNNPEGNFKFPRVIKKNISINSSFYWEEPFVFHMGFSKSFEDMKDKTDYYKNRGEEITRKNTTIARASWFTEEIPDDCKVRNFSGSIPQVLSSNY